MLVKHRALLSVIDDSKWGSGGCLVQQYLKENLGCKLARAFL